MSPDFPEFVKNPLDSSRNDYLSRRASGRTEGASCTGQLLSVHPAQLTRAVHYPQGPPVPPGPRGK